MGFYLNPFDPCITNEEPNNNQCTICWYVDDMKISHKSEYVVSEVNGGMESVFGKIKVARGHKPIFFINFDSRMKGKEIITIKDYIKDCTESKFKNPWETQSI